MRLVDKVQKMLKEDYPQAIINGNHWVIETETGKAEFEVQGEELHWITYNGEVFNKVRLFIKRRIR